MFFIHDYCQSSVSALVLPCWVHSLSTMRSQMLQYSLFHLVSIMDTSEWKEFYKENRIYMKYIQSTSKHFYSLNARRIFLNLKTQTEWTLYKCLLVRMMAYMMYSLSGNLKWYFVLFYLDLNLCMIKADNVVAWFLTRGGWVSAD